MGTSGVILGDWTHRRGDVGGARAVAAEVERARPRVAWTFRPPHAGQVDQVRIAAERVYVATLEPGDPSAVGWEHATVYALDPASGRVVARRELPDPVPVAAMVVEPPLVHVLATRPGEPVFWYVLDAFDLRPRSRRALALDLPGGGPGDWDVLEAWASADGGLWMELEGEPGALRAYAFAKEEGVTLSTRADAAITGDASGARDACCAGHTLYAPRAGDAANPPSIWQLDPVADERIEPWARLALRGAGCRAHAIVAGGAVSAVAVGVDPEKERRALVQAITVDRASGVVRAQSVVERFATRGEKGDGARLARRPNGDVLFQCVTRDGEAASDLWRASSTGELMSMPMPRESLILDAALGDAVLAHAETKNGRVLVSALDIDRERLLGKRAQTLWSIETPDLGGHPTIYAGAGHVLARGTAALAAIRV